eukprot:COSAG02_NODE_658_length_18775_cov_3.825712_6_plen_101_part_00
MKWLKRSTWLHTYLQCCNSGVRRQINGVIACSTECGQPPTWLSLRGCSLQQPKSGYRPQQLWLMVVSSKEELAEVAEDRRLEIITALSDGYMRVRVAVLL